jgi:ADP-ribose pyrophosphatase YjhB (NUDIX family)
VQCIAFTKGGKVVLYKHAAGYVGLPGGTVEEGESVKDALIREVKEESATEIISYEQIAYLKDTNEDSGEEQFQTRYWAEVKLLDEPVVDPDGKALERLLVEPEDVVSLLGEGWGERGAILLKLAQDARNQTNY